MPIAEATRECPGSNILENSHRLTCIHVYERLELIVSGLLKGHPLSRRVDRHMIFKYIARNISIRILMLIGIGVFAGGPMFARPLFKNSVASTEIDFIHTDDPSVAFRMNEVGRERKEMPDKRSGDGDDALFLENVGVFELTYSDGTIVEVWASPQLESSAALYARHCADAMAKLPHALRSQLKHVVVHFGNESAFAEESGGFFVVYSENIEIRLANNDFEETVFHEAIHVALEAEHARSEGWLQAQKEDRAFITQYAEQQPKKEDLPEFALFAYTYFKHPERLPQRVQDELAQKMPNRLKYLQQVMATWGPIAK